MAVDFGREYARTERLGQAKVSAMPRPVSPFNWMVVVETGDAYRYSFVNVVRHGAPPPPGPGAGLIARLDAAYLPTAQAVWHRAERYGPADARAQVLAAWNAAPLGFFRWFAAYPVLAGIEHAGLATCFWFRDLRFLTPGRDAWPFQFGVCRKAAEAGWTAFQLLGNAARLPLR
jgi:inner membrane protein